MQLQRPAVRLRDPSRNRQPETRAVRRALANESFEDALLVRNRYWRSVVGDPDRHAIRRACQARRHATVALCVANCVVQEVADHLAQERVIPGQADLLIAVGRHRDVSLVGQHPKGPGTLSEDVIEIQKLVAKRYPVSLGARQQEHGVDQAGKPVRLLADDDQRLSILLR